MEMAADISWDQHDHLLIITDVSNIFYCFQLSTEDIDVITYGWEVAVIEESWK